MGIAADDTDDRGYEFENNPQVEVSRELIMAKSDMKSPPSLPILGHGPSFLITFISLKWTNLRMMMKEINMMKEMMLIFPYQVFDTDKMKLRLAINTAQYGRTFQDRTHVFAVRPVPNEIDAADSIINMNVSPTLDICRMFKATLNPLPKKM